MNGLRHTLVDAAYRSGAFSVARRGAVSLDRWLTRVDRLARLRRGAVIYMFHRLTTPATPLRLGVALEMFEGFCEMLAEGYEVLPLPDLERRRRAGKSLERMVAITFDDGYADNHELALPVLRRFGLPATVFVTTGFVDGAALPWAARLAHLLQHGRPPPTPHRTAGLAIEMATPAQRERTLAGLQEALHAVDPDARDDALEALARAVGVHDFSPLRREMLTWQQLRDMDAAGFCAGAHTVTHPFLSRLSPERVRQELRDCRDEIAGRLGRPVTTFAYPNGRRDDYNDRVMEQVREAGYELACSTVFGANSPAVDPFELRRVSMYAKTRAEAALQIERFFYNR